MPSSMRLLMLLGFALTWQGSGAAESWHQFRGPDGNGHAASTANVPLEWSREENVAWRTPLPGEGWSSPTVSDGQIFVTAAIPADESDSPDLLLSLIAVELADGTISRVTTAMTQSSDQVAKIHSKNSHASPTPIIDGNRIYVHFGYAGTACVTREGEVLWTTRELAYRPVHGAGGSPILVDDKLIFTCDGAEVAYVAALDAATGNLAWKTPRPAHSGKKFSFCTPTLIEIEGQRQVIAPGSGGVLALAPDDGRILWQADYDGYSVVPKPVYGAGLVFLSTGYDDASLLAFDPTGRGDVTSSHLAWQIDRGSVPKNPSMLFASGLLYLLSDDGIFTCVDAETGKQLYRKRLGGNYSASPILVQDRIYCISEDGTATVIQAGRSFEKLAENAVGERTLASPAAVDDSLILRTSEALYRIR